jgi:hypothetical protein
MIIVVVFLVGVALAILFSVYDPSKEEEYRRRK